MAIIPNTDRPLPPGAQEDIEALLDNARPFAELLEMTRGDKPEAPLARVIRRVADHLSTEYAVASRLFNALDNLHELRQETGGTPRVLSLLERRLTSERAGKLANLKALVGNILDAYSADHPFFISSKASRLSYLHESLYQDGEIITDVRPIFNGDGSKIIEMVVTHSLVISAYRRGWRGEQVHFAMDATDVIKLRDWCNRAIKKADVLKDAMAECQWGVRVLNEIDDGA